MLHAVALDRCFNNCCAACRPVAAPWRAPVSMRGARKLSHLISALLCHGVPAEHPTVHLSVILCGRNDNHAGHFLRRLHWAIRSLSLGLCRETPMLSSEIVVVEWRPVETMPRLSSLIPKWMVRGNNAGDFDCQPENMPPIRVISVADDVADTALREKGAAKDRPMLQWHCKAAGLKRASGEFLAVTNADDIWSPSLFRFLSAVHWFRTDSFFVTHTVDAQHINEGPYPFHQIYDEVFSRNFEWKQMLATYMKKLKARYPVIDRDASRLICMHGDTLPMEFRREEFTWFWNLYDDGFGIRLGLSLALSWAPF